MVHISLPENKERRLVFYLAMEEYVAAHLSSLLAGRDRKDAFFFWQVKPTVIFGRNQVMEAEVNMPYCREHDIRLFRRKSGGGCVYSDEGNIMLSYITDSTNVASTFSEYLDTLSAYLRASGVNAEKSGRNDIMVDGKKVSGNAFFLKPESSIVHGTMLFNTDFDELERAITPSEAKIKSKGVSSVRQHVTNLKPIYEAAGSPLADIEKFKNYLLECFCGNRDAEGKLAGIETIVLTDEQVAEIEEIEAEYLNPEFLEGRNHAYSVSHSGKIPGAGEIVIGLDIDKGVIRKCHVSGDFFPLKDGLDELLTSRLEGVPDEAGPLRKAIGDIELTNYISGLSMDDFLGIMEA